MVVIPEADADGAAGSGQDSRHGVQVDQNVCYSLQDELLVHYGLTPSGNKQENTLILNHVQTPLLQFLPYCVKNTKQDSFC